jgi:hypothetical protein
MELHETMPSHLFLYPTVIDHLQARRANNENASRSISVPCLARIFPHTSSKTVQALPVCFETRIL